MVKELLKQLGTLTCLECLNRGPTANTLYVSVHIHCDDVDRY